MWSDPRGQRETNLPHDSNMSLRSLVVLGGSRRTPVIGERENMKAVVLAKKELSKPAISKIRGRPFSWTPGEMWGRTAAKKKAVTMVERAE